MSDYHVIPCQKGEFGAMYPAHEEVLAAGATPSYHFDPYPEYTTAKLSMWPLLGVAGACLLTYQCNKTVQYETDIAQFPAAMNVEYVLEKFYYAIDDPVEAPAASVGSDEWGPYEIPFGTYTFKYSYVTPEGQSRLSPASNAVSIDNENQWVDLAVSALPEEYHRSECYRRVWVSRDGGPYEADTYPWYLSQDDYSWYYPYLLRRGQPSENTTGAFAWGWRTLDTRSHTPVYNTAEDLHEVFGWEYLVPGGYRLTVTYPDWSFPYTWFTFRGLEFADVNEFRVYPATDSVDLVHNYTYQVDYGWRLTSTWAFSGCHLWDKIQNESELLAAQRSWDEGFGGHYDEEPPYAWHDPPMGVVDEVDWEIIYQTGDVWEGESGSVTNGFYVRDFRIGRPSTREGAGEWHSLGIRTAYRPTAVGQYGYEFQAPYTYDEMQPIADLLYAKINEDGTGVPWIRTRAGRDADEWSRNLVQYNWFDAWYTWAPAQRWGRIYTRWNGLSFLHTPLDWPLYGYGEEPWVPDPDQWSLP